MQISGKATGAGRSGVLLGALRISCLQGLTAVILGVINRVTPQVFQIETISRMAGWAPQRKLIIQAAGKKHHVSVWFCT